MRRGPVVRRTLVVSAVVLALGLPVSDVDASRPSEMGPDHTCADCCMWDCIVFQVHKAEAMLDAYKGMKNVRGLTDAMVDDIATKRSKEIAYEMDAAGLPPQCGYHFPKLNSPEQRRLMRAFTMVTDADGKPVYNLSVTTDMTTCTVNENQVEQLATVVPCKGYADVTRQHEQVHADQCTERQKKHIKSVNAYGNALDEVGAWTKELQLWKDMKKEIKQACKKKSCDPDDATDAGTRLETNVPLLRDAGR